MRALRMIGWTLAAFAGVLLLLFGALQTPPVQAFVARTAAGLASGPDAKLEIAGLRGFFPTDLHVDRIAYADSAGPWLTIDDLRLRWSFLSLLGGRLRIDELSAAKIDVSRLPQPAKEADTSGGGGLSSLPVGIDLRSFSVEDLHLGAALAQVDSHWKLSGSALLPADLAEVRLALEGERIDGPKGRLTADILFDANKRTVDGEIALNEGRGGVMAALLQRPDIDDLSAKLAVRGDAQTGSGELTVAAGDAAQATGKAEWKPGQDGVTAVTVNLDSAAPGLPKGPYMDVARGPAALRVEATVGQSLATISKFTFTTAALAIDATARYDRTADKLEAEATVTSEKPGPLGPLVAGASWRDLHLKAKADLTGLTSRPEGTVELTGGGEDISLTAIDQRLPPVGAATLVATLGVSDGRITVKSLDLDSPVAAVKGGGSYVVASGGGDGKFTVTVPELAPFAALVGQPLGGTAVIDLDAKADSTGYALGWQGKVTNISAAGLPADLDKSEIALSGEAKLARDQAWSLDNVRVVSKGGTLDIAGRGRGATGDLELALDLPKLAVLRPELSGSATIKGDIKLRTEGTDVAVTADLADIESGQLSARQLSLSGKASVDPAGGLKGELDAKGDLVGQPVTLGGNVERKAAGGVVVPSFQGRWASAVIDVSNLAITEARTTGYARVRIPNLQDLSALAGTPLAGSFEAEVTADPQAPEGRIALKATGADLRASGASVGTLELKGTVDDPLGTAATDLTLTASRIAGAADINRLSVTATGDRQEVAVTVQASGAQTSADAKATVAVAGQDISVGLTQFNGRYSGIPIALAAPTQVGIAGSRITIQPTSFRLGGGRLTVRGVVGPVASDLQVEVAGLPLSLIDTVAPGTNLEGVARANAHVTGAMAAPNVQATYGVTGLRLRRPDAALLPSLSVQGSASMAGQRASIDARLSAGGATNLSLKGQATLPQGGGAPTGSATIAGSVDIAPFSPLLGNDIRNVTGTLRPNLTVTFSGDRIDGNGTITLTGAAIAMPQSGLRMSNGEGRLTLNGDTLRIERLVFQTGRGTVTAGGTIRLDPQQGPVLDLTVGSRNALLVSRPDLAATVSSDLKITGSTGAGIDVAGPITIDRAEITVGAQQSAAYPTLDVKEINKPGAKQTVAAAAAPPQPRGRKPPPPPSATPIRLNFTILAPRAIFVRGRGLNAEMSGDLKVTGTPAAPGVIGSLTMRRGTFSLVGRQLSFTKGIVTLDSIDTIDPLLDFVATTTVQSTTINVEIGGTARAPTITVSSVPELPPSEAMALLLFGKPTSRLSAFELAEAAQALAELTGRSGDAGVLSRLRSGLGLDRLSIGSGTDSSGNSSVNLEAGRYVAPGVYVGTQQGATGNSSRGVVQIEVLDHVKIEGDVGADANGRVGVKMEWDY
ncbi:translocation/assembly module TamB domain-containing protein [Reyranella sp.]|uniref:translocation/assembly module TamB domain-containing protein n=1 Tax=Reyranella sp. TaxID=1929291 RepID=UPI003BAC16B1